MSRTWVIQASDRIKGTRVQRAALAAAKMLQEADPDPKSVFKATKGDHALWIEEHGEIVSLLIWRDWKSEKAAWLGIGWTIPSRRCQGLYRSLFDEFCLRAAAAGYSKVGCGIDPGNALSFDVHRGMGFKPCMFTKILPKAEERGENYA